MGRIQIRERLRNDHLNNTIPNSGYPRPPHFHRMPVKGHLVARLPGDAYSLIFSEAIRSSQGHRALQSISGVCKRWRVLSIGDKRLWNTISSSAPPEWNLLSLKRSTPIPLDVVVEFESLSHLLPTRLAFLDAISDEMHRVKSLRIVCCNAEITKHRLFLREAPQLTSLSLCDLSSSSLPIRPFQIQENGSNLRKLELYDTVIAWNSPLFHGLTSLKISCVPVNNAVSIRQILAIFRRCPALEDLHLQEIFQEEETLSLPSCHDIVEMAHLHTISLIYPSLARPLHRHVLLSHIQTPLLRHLTLSHNADVSTGIGHPEIFLGGTGQSHRPKFPNTAGLRFVLPRTETVELSIFPGQSPADKGPLTEDYFGIAYTQTFQGPAQGPDEFQGGRRRLSNILVSLLRTWSMTMLRKVKVVIGTEISLDLEAFSLSDVLKEMQALESLTLCADKRRELDHGSTYIELPYITELCDHIVLCRQNLKELRFEELAFSTCQWSEVLGRLEQAMLGRQNMGYCLQNLIFHSCIGIDANVVLSLRSYVLNLVIS